MIKTKCVYPRDEEAEFAAEVGFAVDDLPRGMVIGTVEIVDCHV